MTEENKELRIVSPKKKVREVLSLSLSQDEWLSVGAKLISKTIFEATGNRFHFSSVAAIMKVLCEEGFMERRKNGYNWEYRLLKSKE